MDKYVESCLFHPMLSAELFVRIDALASAGSAIIHTVPRYRTGLKIIILHQSDFDFVSDGISVETAPAERSPRPGKMSQQGSVSKKYARWEPFDEPYGRLLVTPHRSSVPYVALNWLKGAATFEDWLAQHKIVFVAEGAPLRNVLQVAFDLAVAIRDGRKGNCHPVSGDPFTLQSPLPPILPIIHNQETGRRFQLYIGEKYRGSPALVHLLVVPDSRPLPPFEVQFPEKRIHHKLVRTTRVDEIIAQSVDGKVRIFFPQKWEFPDEKLLKADTSFLRDLPKKLQIRIFEVYYGLKDMGSKFFAAADKFDALIR